ncbi:MAG TPA: SGNH/GDSL hydrolase family protein [Xanthomonadaceae bacterium]|nr:SGNH/GDSL hydrolase family protein [Xanthomonadaceae bacterium]
MRLHGAMFAGFVMVAMSLPAQSRDEPPLRVLFVGNSYLYVNDLPAQVERLAALRGRTVRTTLQAAPDYGLVDHLHDRRFDRVLEQQWDWVVLQQGPSASSHARAELIASVRTIAERLHGRSLRIALVAGWPASRNASMSPAAERSYRDAAAAVGACVMPVATAWRLARADERAPTLYAADGLHATRMGTRLAALTVVDGLFGPARSAPAAANRAAGPRETALLAAASAAYAEEAMRCGALDASTATAPARIGY